MSLETTTLEVAVGIEQRAYSLSKRGDAPFVLSAALFANVLREADFEDVQAIASGDEDALDVFINRKELGVFVAEHIADTFEEIARLELDERSQASKDAWETEMEMRQLVGAGGVE